MYNLIKKVSKTWLKIALTGIFAFVATVSFGQVGKYEPNLHARDTLETDQRFMVARDTVVPILDVSYHEWSADASTWRDEYVLGDRYLRISNDVENTWVEIDLYDRYWVLGTDSAIYVNTDYANKILIDTTTAPSNFKVFTTGDVGADYYFLGTDSLTHTNMYNGGAVDGYTLVASGDTAIWQPAASGVGETNIMQNAGTRGVGVYDNKADTLFNMRNLASLTELLTVTLDAADSVIDLDLVLKTITAGTGLSGGGSMESDISLNLYVPELPSSTVVDSAADWLILYDVSAAAHYKVHPEDLLSVLGAYEAGDGLSLLGNVFSLDTPATVSDTSTSRVGEDDHSHALIIYNLTSIEDVTDSPVSGQYLKWNGTSWVTDNPATAGTTVDLYVDNVLKESSIDQINLVAGQDIKHTYGTAGKVTTDFDWSVTETSSTTPTLNFATYRNMIVNMAGATTITISNLVAGGTGNITILGTGTASTVELSGYTFQISPCLTFTGDVIDTSGGKDMLSFYYDGENVFINGTYGYE
jgi:hypothetical protein